VVRDRISLLVWLVRRLHVLVELVFTLLDKACVSCGSWRPGLQQIRSVRVDRAACA
jgi:hypothetical protein